jgi:hypothetical protein
MISAAFTPPTAAQYFHQLQAHLQLLDSLQRITAKLAAAPDTRLLAADLNLLIERAKE